MVRSGTALLVLGLLAFTCGLLWQFGLVPGTRVVLPAPVALESDGVTARSAVVRSNPSPTPTPELAPVAPVQILQASPPTDPTPPPAPPYVDIPPVPADAAERTDALPPETGYAVRLAIPAIKLDTEVEQASVVEGANGDPTWQTLPFVAVHYGDLTSLIGARGNAVIAGHVVTVNEGNVFRFLYRVNLEDQVQVWDDQQAEHDFRIVDVRLVSPSDTSVMAPTPDETLTLITCGGKFDPVKRQFSDRLIVTATPL